MLPLEYTNRPATPRTGGQSAWTLATGVYWVDCRSVDARLCFINYIYVHAVEITHPCMHVHSNTHTHLHTCMYAHTHTYACTHTHWHMLTHNTTQHNTHTHKPCKNVLTILNMKPVVLYKEVQLLTTKHVIIKMNTTHPSLGTTPCCPARFRCNQ